MRTEHEVLTEIHAVDAEIKTLRSKRVALSDELDAIRTCEQSGFKGGVTIEQLRGAANEPYPERSE